MGNPTVAPPYETGYLRHQAVFLTMILWLLTTVMAIRLGARLPETGVDFLLGVGFTIAIVLICINDGNRLGRKIPMYARWIMLFTWPLASLIYLIWSRGWRGVLYYLVMACLILGWAGVVHVVTHRVLYGAW